jgi:hypothetical protein
MRGMVLAENISPELIPYATGLPNKPPHALSQLKKNEDARTSPTNRFNEFEIFYIKMAFHIFTIMIAN